MDSPDPNGDYSKQNRSTASTSAVTTPQHIPVANNAIGTKGQRRRAGGAPGSRGVANLSAEQLAKKRANDREAQRAIRERTRNTIEGLERRIRELEGQQPFQELQRVIAERDRALAECEMLRRRLGAVAGIVGQPQGGSGSGPAPPGLNELAAYTAQQSPLPPRVQRPSQSPVISYDQQQQHHQVHPDLRSEGTSLSRSPAYHGQPLSQDIAEESRRASPAQVHYTNGGRLDVDFLLEQRPANATSATRSQISPRPQKAPLYSRPTNGLSTSCPLDRLLVDFVVRRRDLLREGVPAHEVLGPEYPDFSAMCDPSLLPQCHPVSAFFIDVLAKFPNISKLPQKIAVFYVMFMVLRWLVCPCQACYERLPEFSRPTPEQIEIPHVAYADYLPWPYMRRQLVLNEKEVLFEDFFVPYCATLCLNWQLSDDRVLLSTPGRQGTRQEMVINPEFERHLRNLDNWSLGNVFRNTFPHLVNLQTMRIQGP